MTQQDIHKERSNYILGIVRNLPETPGVYQYLNESGKIIYVGKAKNLKRRVSSYFNRDVQTRKTRLLVDKIWDIRYIVVNTEEDALLLENNLIKKYKPHYNVLLKDDKTYPSICVSNECFPRIFTTRRVVRDGASYYGPYSHLPSMYALLDLVHKLYMIRRCRLNLTPETIGQGKFSVCLEYHIKNCKGPCVGLQTHEDYMRDIREVKNILSGDTQIVIELLHDEMLSLASQMRFEEAQRIKERIALITAYQSRSEVVSRTIHNVDVFSIDTDEKVAYINYLHITNGSINQAFTFEYKKRLNETAEELLALGIIEMRQRYGSRSKEIILPIALDLQLNGITFVVPQRGEKKHLLDLSMMNVRQYKLDKLKQMEKLNPEQRTTRLLKEIQAQLQMERMPRHIECFDNSNISGTSAVAACVVFVNGKPSKKDYRKYNIKTVVGPDDYASMREVVFRRYRRLVEEEQPLPDLIITDGGKGQMEVVRQVMEEELKLHIPIAGLAKNKRHRTSELLYGNPPQTVGIKQGTPLFHLLERIQDEVHRFAITFHRDKRSKKQIESALDGIKGIGPKRKSALLKHFRSVARIRMATQEELEAVVGPGVAAQVVEGLKEKTKTIEQ